MMMVFMCTLYCWRDEFGELAAFAIWGLCHVIATEATEARPPAATARQSHHPGRGAVPKGDGAIARAIARGGGDGGDAAAAEDALVLRQPPPTAAAMRRGLDTLVVHAVNDVC